MENIKKLSVRWFLFTLFITRACMCAQAVDSDEAADNHLPTSDWQTIFMQLSSTDELETEAWQEAFEVLSELEQNPININSATREDLQRLPFLSEQQIEDMLSYIYQYGGMQTLGELAMIESLDKTHRSLLSFFFYAGQEQKQHFPTLHDIARYGRHQLTADGNIPFYHRHGDDHGYLGYPYRHTLRYDFHYGEYLKVGVLGAQDAGEPFFANGNSSGYDHYSFYAVVRNVGRLKTVAIGRYKLRTGMGLVLNNDIGFGKTMMLSSLSRTPTTIRAYTSRSSANYMQGAAATVNIIGELDLTAFYSYRYIDATLNKESNTIATIRTDGYHRTTTEMEKKNNATQKAYGANLHWSYQRLHVGITALATNFDKALEPNTSQRYRLYYPAGDRFWNASIDYAYRSRRLTISGETATGDSHALAAIHMINMQPIGNINLTLLHRFYSYRYTSLLGQSFNEGGRVQNESGIYFGLQWKPTKRLLIQGYSDYAYFSWLKYLVDGASHAWDNFFAATYNIDKLTIGSSYRLKIKQKNSDTKNALINDNTQRLRFYVSCTLNRLALKTQADAAVNNYKQQSKGWMISQQATYQLPIKWLQKKCNLSLNANISYFHTDDYASRIYAYERGLLYSFSFPANYGEGIRCAFFLRTDISQSLLLIAKLATTDYFDRDHISSSYQQIDRSSKTDLELQLRWKF